MSDSPPIAALGGIRVLDFSTVGPAARCARILADYGADLIKIGAPGKSALQIEPAYWAYGAGRGTRRIRIDLKAREGREACLRLFAQADVVIESYRPGVADRLGVGYADACRVNERIIYCSTSGYGKTGPAAGWAGHDLDYLALGGFLHMSGRRSDDAALPCPAPPSPTPRRAACRRRSRSWRRCCGARARVRGEALDVSVADGVLSLMALAVDEQLATGVEPAPGHDVLSGRYACYGVYGTRDDRWLAVGAIEAAFWTNLCRALGLERWSAHQYDDAQQERIRADLAAACRRRDRDAWVAELRAPANTCVAPVLAISEVAAAPQSVARGATVEVEHPRRRALPPARAAAGRRLPPATRDARARRRRQRREPLLRAAGYGAAEIATLLAAGTVA